MTDDIVTRLRIACRQEGAEYCGECQPCQAANEIERLETETLEINLLWNADKAEVERLRAELNVMAEAVLEAKETISRIMTLTGNYLTTRNEDIVDKLKPYVRAQIIQPELWALAIKHRTKHTSTPDYADRRGFGNE